ncbi:MAG: hypothetical protein Q7S74_00510 [Nanoarchaeota archaeon]|nr:hypothetical protein [Nanoarchaeota archaeon]
MESRAGSILLLISAILTFLASLIAIIFIVVLLVSPDTIKSSQNLSPTTSIIIISIAFIIFLILGFLELHASKLMKDSMTTKKGGIMGLILGILTFNLLAIIGGIAGIIQSGKN